MKRLNRLFYIVLIVVPLLSGCHWSLEQRWEAFDAQMRQEIGVKTEDDYVREWGHPTKRAKTGDGGETIRWEFQGYGGGQGWNKILTFGPDGVLKDFQRSAGAASLSRYADSDDWHLCEGRSMTMVDQVTFPLDPQAFAFLQTMKGTNREGISTPC